MTLKYQALDFHQLSHPPHVIHFFQPNYKKKQSTKPQIASSPSLGECIAFPFVSSTEAFIYFFPLVLLSAFLCLSKSPAFSLPGNSLSVSTCARVLNTTLAAFPAKEEEAFVAQLIQ